MQGRVISNLYQILFFISLTSCGGGGGSSLPTAPASDTTPPLILETIPSSEQAGVLPTDSIKITFNESIDKNVAREQVVVYLINDITGVTVEPAIQLDEALFYFKNKNIENDTLVVPFINTGDLKVSSQYRVSVKNIKDTSGNIMVDICTWDFTTGENGLVTKKINLGKTGLCSTIPAESTPDQAQNIQAFSINETTVLVNWTAPETGSRVDYYQVERSIERVIGEQASFEVVSPFTSILSYLDDAAEKGNKHTYRITAGNSLAGFSQLSALSNPVIPMIGSNTIKPSKIISPDSSPIDQIFAFSPNGMTLAIAYPHADTSNPAITDAGTIKLYDKTPTGWVYTATIISSAPKQIGGFGEHLTFSPDGALLAVQERFADISNGSNIKNAGSVQIFSKKTGGWSYDSTLISITPETGSEFGYVIEFSPDSRTIAIGEPRGNSSLGTVQLFTKSINNRWNPLTTIYSANPAISVYSLYTFGYAIAFNSTGTTLAIGDRYSNVSPVSGNNGSVQLFSKSADGWNYKTTLTSNLSTADRFGLNLAFSPDGSTLAVIEYPNRLNTNDTVHLFHETIDGWVHLSNLLIRKQAVFIDGSNNKFSYLAFSPDSSLLAISSYSNLNINGQQTFVENVTLFSKTAKTWQFVTRLESNTSTDANRFGQNFKFSPDNSMLAISESYGDIINNTVINDTGTVQLFYKTAKGWQYTRTLTSSAPAPNDYFGATLEFSPNNKTLAIGKANFQETYIFDLTNMTQ